MNDNVKTFAAAAAGAYVGNRLANEGLPSGGGNVFAGLLLLLIVAMFCVGGYFVVLNFEWSANEDAWQAQCIADNQPVKFCENFARFAAEGPGATYPHPERVGQ